MKARNIRVTFYIDVYDSRPWFQVPRAIAKVHEPAKDRDFVFTRYAP